MAMSPRLLRPLASGFNPKSLGTLALWLDGADRSRMFSDDAGTTLSADDGQVAVYKEKANGYNLAQTTANNRPLVRSAFLNGKSVLEFDGSNDRLVSPALADDWLATTYFAVIQTTGPSVNPHLFARAALVAFFPGGTTMTFLIAPNGTGINAGAGTLSLNAWARVTGRWTGGTSGAANVSVRINAANLGTGSGTSNRVSLATEPVNIGNRAAGDRTLDGYIAELLIYSQSLSNAAILKVEGYLKTKWGL